MAEEWFEGAVARELIEETAAALAKRYRIGADDARARTIGHFAGNAALLKAIRAAAGARDVHRLAIFREAETALRKATYYELRRYRPNEGRAEKEAAAILEAHASTRERLAHLEEFRAIVAEAVRVAAPNSPAGIIDVGCGIGPLVFPFDLLDAPPSRYLALDRDAESIGIVGGFAREQGFGFIEARVWRVEDGWVPGPACFDLALLLKVVPVVARQDREHLDVLASVPSRWALVSGSREALAKRGSIERREGALLRRFAERAGGAVAREFSTPDEIFLLLELPGRNPP